MRTTLTRFLLILVTAGALTACGNDTTTGTDEETQAAGSATATPSEDSGDDAASEQAESEGTVVTITIKGEDIEPKGDRVEADLGEPVTLSITSDRAGELHVHSTPEQEVAFQAGRTTKKLTFDQPGVVEVEDHESGTVIVQLQVS